jgi:tricorn protease
MVELYSVAPTGGLPEKLPVPYGAFADISPDGRWLAYTPHTTDNRTWKRYRGGMSTDIWLFDLKEKKSKRATTWEARTRRRCGAGTSSTTSPTTGRSTA